MTRRSAHELRVAYEELTPEERAEVATFVRMVQTSETERAVWSAVMQSLARDFRGQGWDDAADNLDRVVASTLELLDDIDQAKKQEEPEAVQ